MVDEVPASWRGSATATSTRIYTAHELECCRARGVARRTGTYVMDSLAARFAAKEAVMKVLRPAEVQPEWRSIELHRMTGGWCEIRLSGRAAELAVDAGIEELAVSVSHEAAVAAAVVVGWCTTRDEEKDDRRRDDPPGTDRARAVWRCRSSRWPTTPTSSAPGMTSHASVNVMLALEDAFDFEFSEKMLKKSTFESIGAIRAGSLEMTAGDRDDDGRTTMPTMTACRRRGRPHGRHRRRGGRTRPPRDVDERAGSPRRRSTPCRPRGCWPHWCPPSRVAEARPSPRCPRAWWPSAGAVRRAPWSSPCTTSRWPAWSVTGTSALLRELPGRAGRAPVPAGLGHDRGGHRGRCPVQHLRPRGRRRAVPGGEAGAGDLLRRRRRRRAGDGPSHGRQPRASDQVIVLCRPPGLELEQVGEWNALGFRGTCSTGFVLRATGDVDAVLGEPYADISTRTMLPVAHLLWSSVWLGIATDAVDLARRFVQAEARRKPGYHPAGVAAAGRDDRHPPAVRRHGAVVARPGSPRPTRTVDRLSSIGFGIGMNALKVSASTLVVDIVRECMLICGLASYRLDSALQPGSPPARRHGGRADGEQRPDHGQQRADAPRPPGRVTDVSPAPADGHDPLAPRRRCRGPTSGRPCWSTASCWPPTSTASTGGPPPTRRWSRPSTAWSCGRVPTRMPSPSGSRR